MPLAQKNRKDFATELVCVHVVNNLDLLNEISELSEKGLDEFFHNWVYDGEYGYLFTDILTHFLEDVNWSRVREQIDTMLLDF